MGFVYFFLNINDNSIKIGFTKNIEQRKKSLSTGSSGKLVLLGYIKSDDAIGLEKQLHRQFVNFKIRQNGEWFLPKQSILDYLNKNSDIKNNWIELDNGKVRVYKRMKK